MQERSKALAADTGCSDRRGIFLLDVFSASRSVNDDSGKIALYGRNGRSKPELLETEKIFSGVRGVLDSFRRVWRNGICAFLFD